MAKFGLYSGGNIVTDQEYEGDYMKQSGEYVSIYNRNPDTSKMDIQVAAIKLDKGQSVKKID